MMVGTVPTSVPQFILLGNWLLEHDFKRKWAQIKNNKLFWILSAVFLMHVAGLFYTSDLAAGLNDVRTKIPLLFLPLIFFSSKPFTKTEFHFLLYCFLLGCLVNVSWCYIYSFILHKNEVARSASRFMSHIRLGLYLNMAISSCVYFIYINKETGKRVLFALLIACFMFSMYILGLASGFVNLFILVFLASCYLIMKQSLKIKLLLISFLGCGIFAVCNYVKNVYESQIHVNQIPYNSILAKNFNGRWYSQIDPGSGQKENGNYVLINVHFDELKREWNRRCPIDTFAYSPQYNLKRFDVLLRYLTSKTLTKDSLGIWQLTKEDIANIHNNITNFETSRWSYLHKRVYEIVYEYDELRNKRNINGHSLTMRPYFWKAALMIVREHPLTGVGTGDVQPELNAMYVKSGSPLKKDWYKRPHNQYLTIMVALGVVGLLAFLISLVCPLLILRGYFHVLFFAFFVLGVVSFLLEDTLESQAGVTFFAFFNSLFMAQAYYNLNNKGAFKKQHIPGD
ncbi:MAG: hypothetical protein JWO32_2704 [Bacteroidetes bacterium]|nr:hypothetical protein [Bacteroidota bacterium]